MSDPRPALNQLIAALERHLEASSQRRGEDDPTVVAAYEDLADAFEAYDDALHDATGEMTPLVVVDEQFMVDDDDDDDDSDDDDSDDDYDDDEGDQSYSGLDGEDYDSDESKR
ncbi:primosomal protein [Janibacter limosus]|uniref:Primosomal protein n=1 Tax=Janibacter limosus TaxID=53458 RepID=A0A4P6MXB8_9MICO|nr:primosomal protein [Janibacter limosus]QBF46083.1 primosomal protein [Janibacter limosus]